MKLNGGNKSVKSGGTSKNGLSPTLKSKRSQELSDRFYQYPLQIQRDPAIKLSPSKEALLDKARKAVQMKDKQKQ